MSETVEALRSKTDESLSAGKPEEAVAYLAELVARVPDDRQTRLALAISLGDAGNPVGALKVLRATANRLAHEGYLLAAMIVVRHGLEHAPDDQSLLSTLKRLHVRGVRAKAGNLPAPPPLKPKTDAPETANAEALLGMDKAERLEKATEIGSQFPAAGEAAIPLPMPLFSELDEESFIETVKHLHYKRVGKGHKLLEEGAIGDTLLIIASGHVAIEKGGTELAKVGPGTVLGEMALITGAPRSASAISTEDVEFFELSRQDVEKLSASKPKIAEELVEYCRKRLISNLLRTSPLFKRFDDDTRFTLLDRFQRQGYQNGQKIIEQGQPGNGLFVVATGEVEVSVADGDERTVVANLGPGDVVGEISLLKHQPTTATVMARGRVGALFLPRDDFQSVLDEHPTVREFLEGLSDDRVKQSQEATEGELLDADDLIVL